MVALSLLNTCPVSVMCFCHVVAFILRLRNDLYCVEWGVKLYSLTHPVAFIQYHHNYYTSCCSPYLEQTMAMSSRLHCSYILSAVVKRLVPVLLCKLAVALVKWELHICIQMHELCSLHVMLMCSTFSGFWIVWQGILSWTATLTSSILLKLTASCRSRVARRRCLALDLWGCLTALATASANTLTRCPKMMMWDISVLLRSFCKKQKNRVIRRFTEHTFRSLFLLDTPLWYPWLSLRR